MKELASNSNFPNLVLQSDVIAFDITTYAFSKMKEQPMVIYLGKATSSGCKDV